MKNKFVQSEIKSINKEDVVDISIPPIIATVSFEARTAGSFIVDVKEDGSWCVENLNEKLKPGV